MYKIKSLILPLDNTVYSNQKTFNLCISKDGLDIYITVNELTREKILTAIDAALENQHKVNMIIKDIEKSLNGEE